jgi:hypothetical protein
VLLDLSLRPRNSTVRVTEASDEYQFLPPARAGSVLAPREIVAAVLLLVALLALLFASNFRSDMVTDDPVCVATGRIANERGLGAAHAIFSELLLRPFPLLLYALNYRLFHLNLTGYHLSNALWHLANTLLVLAFAWRFTRSRPLSLLAAAFFAAHFAHWENEVWVAAVEDVYAGFFFLVALLAYDRYLSGGPRRWYGVTLAAAIGALLSKEIGVMLAPMLLAADLLSPAGTRPWSDRLRASARRTWPFFAMALLFGALLIISGRVGRIQDYGRWAFFGRHVVRHPINYLGWMIWPFNTAGEVPGALAHSSGWGLLKFGFWVARLAMLAFVARVVLRGNMEQRLTICWLLLAIAPYSFRTAMFPRYSYIATAMFTLLAVQVAHCHLGYEQRRWRTGFYSCTTLFIALNVLLLYVSPSVAAYKQYGKEAQPLIDQVLERRREIAAASEVWLIDPPALAPPGPVAVERTWNYIVQLVCDRIPHTRCLRWEEWQTFAGRPRLSKDIRVYRWQNGAMQPIR